MSVTTSAPITIATSTNLAATKCPANHKLFQSQGLYWLFYLNAGQISYIYSSDNVNWSSPVSIFDYGYDVTGEQFDVYYDVPTGIVWIVLATANPSFAFASGVPSASGINFTQPLVTVPIAVANGDHGLNRPTIRTDTEGNVYVAAELSEASGTATNDIHVGVFVAKIGSSSFTQVFDWDSQDTSTDYMGILSKFTAGKMALYYGSVNGGEIAFLQDWSGSAWGPQINLTSGVRLEPMNGAGITIGDTMYWGGFDTDSTGYIGFFAHAYGDTSVPVQTQLSGPNANVYISDGQGCLASDGTNIIVFYSGAYGFGHGSGITTVFYRVSNDLGHTWDIESTLASGEAGIQGKTLQCTDIIASAQIQVAWTSGTASPYAVRYAVLQTAQLTNGTLTGKVEDTSGNPLQGAQVTLVGTSNTTTTDANGNFSLSSVTFGPTQLSAALSGYQTTTISYAFSSSSIPPIIQMPKSAVTLIPVAIAVTAEQIL